MTSESRTVLQASVSWTAAAAPGPDGAGEVEGWAAVYNVVGDDGDVVTPGAFRKTAHDWSRAKQPLPLIADHELSTTGVVGSITELRDEPAGLRFRARFAATQKAQDLRRLVVDGHVRGVSWTAAILRSRPGNGAVVAGRKVARYLDELRVFELTISPWPVFEDARVLVAAASAPTVEDVPDIAELEAWAATALDLPPALTRASSTPPPRERIAIPATPRSTPMTHTIDLHQLGRDIDQAAATVQAGPDRHAFLRWLRTGDTTAKAALVANASGQVLIPNDLGIEILSVARQGIFRRRASVRPTNRIRHRAGLLSVATVGWGRLETGSAATDPNVQVENPPQDVEVHDLTAIAQIGDDELADTDEAAAAAVVDAIGSAMVDTETAAFAAGTGTNQPRGLFAAANIARVAAGNKVTAAASNTPTWAQLSSLPFLLADRYRDAGIWLMHPTAAARVAALPEAQGFEPGPNGRGLLGWPVAIVSAIPDPATAGTADPAIAFVDLGQAYRVAARSSIAVQRLDERYKDLGMTGLVVRMRVGGDLIRPQAVALYLL